MIPSGYEGCNQVRIYNPAYLNGFRLSKMSSKSERMTPKQTEKELGWADVVVFHRPETKEYQALAELCKKDGKKIVVDNDDTFKLDDYHPLANFTPDAKVNNLELRNNAMDKMVEMADLVTTSTEFLANEYRKINKNVVVLPNCINPDDWATPLRNEKDKVRIGIVGSAALEYDYLHVKELIKKLSERDDVEIVMFGLGDMKHRKANPTVTKVFHDEYEFWDSIKMEQIPWCPAWQYSDILNRARLDLMIIPRKDNYFNRCKSNIKFLEASLCEIPCIAQGFITGDSPYQDPEDQKYMKIIINNDDWEKEIEELIQDKELRLKMGKSAHDYVLSRYDINNNYIKWLDAYESLFNN